MPALAEAYRPRQVEFLSPREIVGSKAFNLEYLPPMSSDKSLRTDIISYLGEYRFKIPKFEYSLYLAHDERGSFITDSQGNSMEEAADRSIAERTMRGDPVHRELHERRGLTNLKNTLLDAKKNDGIAWGSPPGPKDEGYGNYGFIYSGKVGGEVSLMSKTGRKIAATELTLQAIRVEDPTIDGYNKVFSQITGKNIQYATADEYLSSPFLSKEHISEEVIDSLLRDAFSFTPNEEEQSKFQESIDAMGPLIDRVVYAIQNNKPNSEKIRLFYALENYAIALKEGSVKIEPGLSYGLGKDIDTVVANFGRFKPPVATGSCGSTGSLTSNRLFGTLQALGGIFESNDDAFECPKCSYTTTKPVGDQCPSCRLTKAEFMEEGGIACD
jgi:hypothetical protein